MQEFKVYQCLSELIYYHLCKTLVKIRLCNLITGERIVDIIYYFFLIAMYQDFVQYYSCTI